MAGLLVSFITAFLVSLLITPVIRKLAFRFGAIDRPDARKVHSRLMPRMGGLGVYLAFTLTVLWTQELSRDIIGLLVGGTIITMIGLIDDIKSISPRIKLLGQIVAAGSVVAFGIKISILTNPLAFYAGPPIFNIPVYFGIPLTVLWIVGVTNAVNLVDGLDGLAGGLASIAALTLAVIGFSEGNMTIVVLALILSASTFGFLKYNFHPAKIFLGDTGSLFLGFMLAGISVVGLTKSAAMFSVFVPVLILGIPIFDTLLAIVRRYINNQPIMEPDKAHLHHRLLALGLSHKQTVIVIYVVSFMLGVSAVFLTFLTSAQAFAVFLGITVVVLIGANMVGVIGKRAVSRIRQSENRGNVNM